MKRAFSIALTLSALLGAPALAGAQGSVTLGHFRPAETAEDGFALSRPDDRGHLRFGAQLMLDYANDPLVFLPAASSMRPEIGVVRNQFVAHVGVHLGLFDRLVLFAGMPFNVLMEGAGPMAGLAYTRADGPGLGDTSLGGRVRLYGERADVLALALQATFTLPTAQWSDATQHYSGERGGTLTPEVVAEARYQGFRFTLNLGARLRFTDEARLETITIGHELTWGAGITIPIVDQESNGIGLTGHVEAYGATSFATFGDRETSPVELIAALRVEPVCGLHVGVGAGAGVSRGYGAPDARALLTLGFSDWHCTHTSVTVETVALPGVATDDDPDRDGIPSAIDACATAPEDLDGFEDQDGCPDPDNDGDGVLDVNDEAPLEPEDRDGFQDADGVPDLDDDRDGVTDANDACPADREDVDTFEDENGCPDLDNDGDGVLDMDDLCPLSPGTLRGRGCSESARIDAETGTIVIFQRIEFSTSRGRIVERSFPILQEIADLLAAHPEVTRVRIEGHTDDRGRDGANLELSRRRAASVVRWLVAHGVEPSRLEAWGCGEVHPIATNGTREGRQDNRRVELHVLAPLPASGPRAIEGCVESSP
jgi:outer membrane protein OmpA-like peptidoglycan-associated protein